MRSGFILLISAVLALHKAPRSFIRKQNRLGDGVNCQKYMCKPPNMAFSSNTCVYQSLMDNTNYLQPCPSDNLNNFCDPAYPPQGNVTCTPPIPQITQSYPGEICESSEQCLHGSCINQKCSAQNLGQNCQDHDECNPGLRCFNEQCVPQISANSTVLCLNDYDCVSNAGCNRTGSAPGFCVPYFTVPVGGIVGDCDLQDKYSFLCIGGSCAPTGKDREGMCIIPYTTVTTTKGAKICKSNLDCYGKSPSTNTTYNSTCECGLNGQGNSYCFPNDGDGASSRLRDTYFQFALTGALEQCNTLRRFEPAC